MAVGEIKFSIMNSAFERPQKVAFIAFDRLSMVALASAIEPLRLANRLTEKNLFDWSIYSLDGEAVMTSSKLKLMPDLPLSQLQEADIALICTGVDVEKLDLPSSLVQKLRALASRGAVVGSLCTGTYILAKLKLLEDHRCTIHWENIRALREEFPHINVSNDVFEIDGSRMTCAGGTAALDMMLMYIAHGQSVELARKIAEVSLHQTIREGKEEQRYDLESRLGISNRSVLGAIGAMNDHIEDLLSCQQIAMAMNISTRQLERLFKKYFDCTPGQYYLRLRLDAARDLLRRTRRSILDVSLATGFSSTSHFTKCFREYYGHTPSKERQNSIWATAAPVKADETVIEGEAN
ncbi:MAG: GlxA family transcriptional regulator [Cohaesibacter sp.]|jgi:transcriptional regulator GlxA family with amidase domain|nr:GlxA family transcriptional regulator [Cohaesibacter sp.]